jgi:tRNA(adenine34) deaminase
MTLALAEARRAAEHDDVPIGCVIVQDDIVLAAAWNERELREDPTAHAEILALREAGAKIGTWRLDGCSLYVTLEPCAMCAGAVVLARVARVVFAAADPKAGFAGSLGNLVQDQRLNHRVELVDGVLADEATDMLREFFGDRRWMLRCPRPPSSERAARDAATEGLLWRLEAVARLVDGGVPERTNGTASKAVRGLIHPSRVRITPPPP